jgi:hypothetical protein
MDERTGQIQWEGFARTLIRKPPDSRSTRATVFAAFFSVLLVQFRPSRPPTTDSAGPRSEIIARALQVYARMHTSLK